MSTISSFKDIKNRHDVYRGKDCMTKVCESLREHKIINFKKKNMKSLTNEQQDSCENEKICYICKGKFEEKYAKNKKYRKVRDYFHYTVEYSGGAHSMCNLKYSIPKEVAIIFHN